MDILKFITAGSVDDGKSTLIGRLLYDSKSIFTDQLEAVKRSSKNKGDGEINLALLTDGLRDEREQGITIDVAYRYFSTLKRKFIIVDAPGHVQYTRNMITGISNVDLAIVLVDARNGITEQTRRHSIIASLLGINKIVVAINKMDLVNFEEDVYNNIIIEYNKLITSSTLKEIYYLPVSALLGDNVVEKSAKMPWYEGLPLLRLLEEVKVEISFNEEQSRFQVQLVLRPQIEDLHDYRGYAGKIISGFYTKGDKVKVFPSGIETEIVKIEFAGEEVLEACTHQSVTFIFKDDIDISRGDSVIKIEDEINETSEIEVLLCWLNEEPLKIENIYILQHNARRVRVMVKNLIYKLNINSLQLTEEVTQIKLNDIVKAHIKTASPLVIDTYKKNKHNGSAILIDEVSNNTVAAVMFQ